MRTKVKIVLLILSLFFVVNISAQEFYNSVKPLTTSSNTLNYKLTGKQYYFTTTLKGTVYLSDDWLNCSLKLENGDSYENVHLRLNTLTEELIFFNQRTGAIMTLDKSIVEEFVMDTDNSSNNLFRKVYFNKAPRGYHYFNVLYDNEAKLYLWNTTEEVKTSTYKDFYGFLRDSEYKSDVTYFLVLPDNSIYKVYQKRRSFLQLFPEQKRNLRKLFRKNRIRFNSSQALIQATQLIEKELF